MPKNIYIITSLTMNAVKIGKTTRNIKELRSDYTRSYGSNMCIHYFEVNELDLDSLERLIHNELKEYKKTNELYEPAFYTFYLEKIGQIIKNFVHRDVRPIHHENGDEYMHWYPT